MTTREAFTVDGPAGQLRGTESGPAEPGDAALPVLLIHGINMTSDVWTEVVDILSRERRVVTFDLRGHGASDKAGPFGAEQWAADAKAVLDARGIARAHVVGTSFGGSVACALAVSDPERVASVASFGGMLAAPGFDLDGAVGAIRAAGPLDFFRAFLPQASFSPGTDQALIDRALASATEGRDVETVIDVSVAAFTADTTETACAVRAPALVVTGELDMTCPVPAGAAVAQALGTEHVVVAGAGHVVSMERPDEVVRLIADHAAAHDGLAVEREPT